MSGNPIPPSQIPSSQIDYERRELENFRGRLSHENELVLKLKGILREITDQEKAATAILKATSPDNTQYAYDRRLATEALEELAEKRIQTEERLTRRQAVIKQLNSQIGALNVSEIERRDKIAALAARLARS
jgi:hypothetical protein